MSHKEHDDDNAEEVHDDDDEEGDDYEKEGEGRGWRHVARIGDRTRVVTCESGAMGVVVSVG